MLRSRDIVLTTATALAAFAANSILARLALRSDHIDPAMFTLIRLVTGAVTLTLLARRSPGHDEARAGRGAIAPLALFTYAAAFSFAYVRIGAAAGALLLFGAVQLTMIGWGLIRRERPGPRVWLGAALAAAGLAWLMLPAFGRPDPVGGGLMIAAGVAWGVYSLVGRRGGADPLAANARSFIWSVPLALALELSVLVTRASPSPVFPSWRGLALATASGAVTSGLGYAIWFHALRGLTATQAAAVQLAVPVLAALAAVVILQEPPSPRLAMAAAAVLGGLGLVVSDRRRR